MDLSHSEDIRHLDVKCDFIIHAANETSPEAHADSCRMLWSTIDSWRNILKIGRACGCQRILLVSSGAVYGEIGSNGASESDPANINFMDPRNSYALGKQICEQSAAAEQNNSPFDIVIARCFSFIGPGLPLDQAYAIGNFIRDAITNNSIRIKSDGSAVRSYLHMKDLVVWLLTILVKGARGEAYNVGSERQVTIRELAHLVSEEVGGASKVIIEGMPSRGVGTNIYYPRIDKAKGLGLSESQDLRNSIIELAQFAREIVYAAKSSEHNN